MVADHLVRLELGEKQDKANIQKMFPDEQLMRVDSIVPWFANYVNYPTCKVLPPELSSQQKKKFLHDVKVIFGMIPCCLKGGRIKL